MSFEIRRNYRLDEINQLLIKHVFNDYCRNVSYARVKMCETKIDPCYKFVIKLLKNEVHNFNLETIDLLGPTIPNAR